MVSAAHGQALSIKPSLLDYCSCVIKEAVALWQMPAIQSTAFIL
jgi:hypothetical protein